MKKFVLLVDLDDTLLDFKKSEEVAIDAVFKKYNIPIIKSNKELYSKINLFYWKKLERKEITRPLLLIKRFEDFFFNFNIKLDSYEEVNKLYFNSLKEQAFLYEDSLSFLNECKRRNIPLVICSNGVKEIQINRLKKADILSYFDEIFVSEEVGFTKPDPQFFEFVLKKLNINNDECLMLGDSLTSDIKGANASNIKSCWLTRSKEESSLPTFTIHSLNEFFKIYEERF